MPTLNGSNSNGSERFEANNVVFDTNVFNGSAYGNPSEQTVDVSIPLENEGTNCSEAIVNGTCTFVFSGDRNGFPVNMDYRVISYPRGFLGSMGGRYCTAGFVCGAFTNATLTGRRALGATEESPVFDLRIPQSQIGLPNSVGNINSLVLTADANHCAGSEPIANYFVDAYIYDTTQYPPLPQYSGTINGINDLYNRMWNTNIWFGHPNQDAMWAARQAGNFSLENALIEQFTGGNVVASDFQLVAGGDTYKLVFKHEDVAGNNFFYVGFVRVEMADGTIPDPTDFMLPYHAVLDYIKTNAFWNLVQAQGQSIITAMANNPARPLTLVRPNDSMFIDGVAMGNESFGQPDGNSGTICWNEMRWDLNGQSFGGKSSLCRIPFDVTENASVCQLPLTIEGNFDCGIPFDISGGRLPGPVVTDCLRCPSVETLPKLSVPYGGSAPMSARYFGFDDNVVINYLSAEVISGNLSGTLAFDPLQPDVEPIYTPPANPDICDTECGRIRISYEFNCPGEAAQSCCLECVVCSFPNVSNRLQDETIFMTGTSALIAVAQPIDISQPICPPITQPPVGSFLWVGDGWRFDAPANWWGTFDVVVPVYANGDKAHENLRCVTICRQGPAVLQSSPKCNTMVFIKDKARSGDQWTPALRVRSFNLTISSISSGEYVDFETCRRVVLDQLRQEWTGGLAGQFLCGDRRIYLGRDLDIRIDKDVTDPNTAQFFGTARIETLSTSFQYTTDNNSDDQQANYSLKGHGDFYALNWAI